MVVLALHHTARCYTLVPGFLTIWNQADRGGVIWKVCYGVRMDGSAVMGEKCEEHWGQHTALQASCVQNEREISSVCQWDKCESGAEKCQFV